MKKETKRKIKYHLAWYGWVYVIALLCLVLWVIPNNFNPETDVCEKCYLLQSTGWRFNYPLDYNCEDIKGLLTKDEKFVCEKHRPKTKCELNPEDEDCVCDEYEEDKYTGWYVVQRHNGKSGGRSFNDLNSTQFYWLINNAQDNETYGFEIHSEVEQGKCHSAHEKNECEKGNKDYISECNLYRIFSKDKNRFGGKDSWLYSPETFKTHKDDNWVNYWKCDKPICRLANECEKGNEDYIEVCYLEDIDIERDCDNITNECICNKKTCRPKTINDLSCDELEEAWQEVPKDEYGLMKSISITQRRTNIEHTQLLKGCFK